MSTSLHFGPHELRPEQRMLLVDGKPAALGSRAFDVLVALVELRPRVVSKNELLDLVWPDVVVEENNLQTQVCTLRKILGPHAIETIPGRGYRFTMASGEAAPDPAPADAAPVDTPPASTQRLTNLPAAAAALVGRSGELDELAARMEEHRLVTLLGAGGIGKSCLAQAVARRFIGRYANGVWWVDLAPITAAAHLAGAIANASNVHLVDGEPLGSLLGVLATRETLLVLDNCERWTSDIAALATMSLAAAPRLRLLVTSQAILKAPGENIYRLDPLTVPTQGATLEQARECAAVQLFEQRARAADRRFSLGPSTVDAVVRLCRGLDGIPLAIEMAAARMPLLGLDGIDAHLGERLRYLRSSSRTAPQRQQTLRSTLEWSHALLGADEQTVLRRLGAFGGTFRLDAAMQLCASDALDEWAVLDALGALVDKSLVQLEPLDPPRYRLLETTRLYALERLAEHDEVQAMAERHAAAMALVAAEVEHAYWRTPDAAWLEQHAGDYDDLKAAYAHACAAQNSEMGAAMLDALFRLDHLRSNFPPMREHLFAAAALLPGAGLSARSRLHLRLSTHFVAIDQQLSKQEAARQAVEGFRLLGDRQRLYEALLSLAVACATHHQSASAQAALAEARAVEDPAWPPRLLWLGAYFETRVHTFLGNAGAYRDSVRAELPLAQRAGSPCQAANARLNLADAALMAEDWDEAIKLARAAVAEVRPLDLPHMLAVATLNLCAALLNHGDLQEARSAALEALPVAKDNHTLGYLLSHVSLLAAKLAQPQPAMQLVGYVQAWFADTGLMAEPGEARSLRIAGELARDSLSSARIEQLQRTGALLGESQAIALANSVLTEDDRGRVVASG